MTAKSMQEMKIIAKHDPAMAAFTIVQEITMNRGKKAAIRVKADFSSRLGDKSNGGGGERGQGKKRRNNRNCKKIHC